MLVLLAAVTVWVVVVVAAVCLCRAAALGDRAEELASATGERPSAFAPARP